MDNPMIFIILMMVVSIGITAAILVVILKRRQSAGGLFAGGGEEEGFPRNGSGEHDGVAYSYHYHPGSKNSPSSYTVKVAHPSTVTFKVSRESGFDRFAEKLGLNVELKTGDPEFDETFYITSSATEYMRTVLGSSATRQLIREIHDLGFTSIELNRKALKSVWTPFRHKRDMDRARLQQVAGLLVRLHASLPEAFMISSSESGWKARRVVAFAIPIAVDLLGVAALVIGLTTYTPLDGWPLALSGLLLSIPLFLLFLYFAFSLLKGRSASHREFFLVALLALFGFPLAGAGVKIWTNGALDTSPAIEHEVRVVDRYISTSDDDESYHAIVQSWRAGQQTEKITVTESLYRRLSPGSSIMTISTRSGKWGSEWLEGYALR